MGCSSWGREESDMTEWLHFHFSLSCVGEGNGNPLQCSCLENPRDGGAWWVAVYGVTQSRTRLKRLSSSSSSEVFMAQSLRHQHHSLTWGLPAVLPSNTTHIWKSLSDAPLLQEFLCSTPFGKCSLSHKLMDSHMLWIPLFTQPCPSATQ